MRRHLFSQAGVWCVAILFAARWALAGDSLIDVLPAGAVVSAELVDAEAVLRQVRNSDLLRTLVASDAYQQWSDSNDGRKFRAGVAILESQLGANLWDISEKLYGHRIAFAAYLPSAEGTPPNGVLVARFAEESTGAWLREKLSPLIELSNGAVSAADRDGTWILETKDQKLFSAVRGSWLVLSNQASLRDDVLNRIRGDGQAALSASLGWQQARSTVSPDAGTRLNAVWDAAPVKARLSRDRLLPSEVDNPLGSLLLGGLMEVAAVSPFAQATVAIHDTGYQISVQSPVGAQQVDAPHQTLLTTAKEAKDLAPAVPRQLAAFTLCRKWSEWYRQREELLEDRVLPEFDKFETGLSTFLPGKDFCEDVLSLLNPPLSFVVAEQTYPHLDGQPAMQIPAFAAVLDMTDPARGSDVFQLFFQTLGTIVNIEAGKQGRQPWVMSSESHRDIQVTFAKYLDRPQGKELPMVYNFQPASAVVGNKYVAATSLELCRDLIDAIQQGKTSATSQPALRNLELTLDAATGAKLIETNRAIFTARGVQAGKSLEQSNREVDLLVEVLRGMTPVSLVTNVSPDRVELRLEGGWK